MDAQTTGKRIAEQRKAKGWTQKDIAEQLHVSVAAVSKWERGLNYPDLSLMEQLAELLDISVSKLLGLEHESTDPVIRNMIELSVHEKESRFRALCRRLYILAGTVVLFIVLSHLIVLFGREDRLMSAFDHRGLLNLLAFLLGVVAWVFGIFSICIGKPCWKNLSFTSMFCCSVSLYIPTLVNDLIVRFEHLATIEDTIGAYNFAAAVLLLGTVLFNICAHIIHKQKNDIA
ncbi:MAG: helix-turn-helix transcriptional regulator [Clostridia bacterium]|nr:helix-turn-helix transcriptional regulator [Clostridia bacterium]